MGARGTKCRLLRECDYNSTADFEHEQHNPFHPPSDGHARGSCIDLSERQQCASRNRHRHEQPSKPSVVRCKRDREELHCSELHLLRLIRQRCRPDFTGESYFNRTGRCSIDGSNSRQTQHRQTADAFIKAEDNSQKSAATLSKLILSKCENSPCRRQGQLATDAVHGNKTGGLSSE